MINLFYDFLYKHPSETCSRYIATFTFISFFIFLIVIIVDQMNNLTADGLVTALSASIIPLLVVFTTLLYQKRQVEKEKLRKKKVLVQIIILNITDLKRSIANFREYIETNQKKFNIDGGVAIKTEKPNAISVEVLKEIGYHTIYEALENHLDTKKAKAFTAMWKVLSFFTLNVEHINKHFKDLTATYEKMQTTFANQVNTLKKELDNVLVGNNALRNQIHNATQGYNIAPNKQSISIITYGFIIPVQKVIANSGQMQNSNFMSLNESCHRILHTYKQLETVIEQYKTIFTNVSTQLMTAEMNLQSFLSDIEDTN